MKLTTLRTQRSRRLWRCVSCGPGPAGLLLEPPFRTTCWICIHSSSTVFHTERFLAIQDTLHHEFNINYIPGSQAGITDEWASASKNIFAIQILFIFVYPGEREKKHMHFDVYSPYLNPILFFKHLASSKVHWIQGIDLICTCKSSDI